MGEAGGYLNDFRGQIGTDLNTPQALASLWGAIKDPALSSADKLALVGKIDDVLGLRLLDSGAPSQELEDRYLELIRERERARAARDYSRADEIREELARAGVAVEDTPSGTRWTRDPKLTDQPAQPETGGGERNPS